MWLLRAISLPYFARHTARIGLTLLGIALGVAATVATSSVTDSVFGSFRQTVEATAGRAALHLTNGGAGVPEELVNEALSVPGVAAAAPLVEGFVTLIESAGETVAIFGLDLLGDGQHEAQMPRAAVDIPDNLAFVNAMDSVAIPRTFATARGYRLADSLAVTTPDGPRQLVVRGLLEPVGPARLFGGVVGLMDLPAAQRLLAKDGKVDRVDITLEAGASSSEVARQLERQFHGRARVEEGAAHGAKAQGLLFSLRVALALAGLVAVVVGFFIIYHTVTVSIVHRRREIALLNTLGVSRRSLLLWLSAEAALLAVTAAAIGFALGWGLARAALGTFGTVANAWIELSPEAIAISPATVVLAVAVSLITTFAATLVPAWTMLSRPTASLLRPASVAGPNRRGIVYGVFGTVAGLLLTTILLAVAPVTLPYRPLVAFIFVVNCLALVSFALLSPAVALLLGHAVRAASERARGVGLLLAGGAVSREPAAAVAVVAAIVMGLGWTLADASLIASFKRSWLGWLDAHYQSDLVITRGSAAVSFLTGPPILEDVVDAVRALPGVRDVQGVRITELSFAERPAVVEALDKSASGLPLLDGQWENIAEPFWSGAGVVLSDKLAHRTQLAKGSTIIVPTPSGERQFQVLGVFSDFQNGDLGAIAMSRILYRDIWRDRVVSSIRVWTASHADVATVRSAIQRTYGTSHGLNVLTAGEFRDAVAALIEDAFSITYALVLVALTISFVGVVNFLLVAVLERRSQLRTLRALGVPGEQIAGAIVTEGALLGSVGVAVGLLAGVVVSRIIVLHSVPMVNGLQFVYEFPGPTAGALSLAMIALGAAAGVIPGRLATRSSRTLQERAE
jgi:putative ABC transport system permease protein